MTQGDRLIDEFITDFLNLKLEAQVSDGFAQHILLQNVGQTLLEKMVLKYREPVLFNALVTQLRTVDRDIEYLQIVQPVTTSGIKEKNKFQEVQFDGKCCMCR